MSVACSRTCLGSRFFRSRSRLSTATASSRPSALVVASRSMLAILRSSRTAYPSAAYRRFRFSFTLAFESIIFAVDFRKSTRSLSVLISSEIDISGSYLWDRARVGVSKGQFRTTRAR